MSVEPKYCLLCGAAHVKEDTPANSGWEWSASGKGWVCFGCLCGPAQLLDADFREEETEPNLEPEWVNAPRRG